MSVLLKNVKPEKGWALLRVNRLAGELAGLMGVEEDS
ncbi:hypothetical protein KN1_29670 [Stygiolobus caldivivus]|uniref:Uncharacterized protein n=1 Tax=Stygiolobus caldivivus TaxID=2824673 RepID=A0A8D5ZKS1_9CREN|nr:hypothetical protein KN1_29670 [Stygiolobus caldivivus]